MKIEIDTREESARGLRRLARFLEQLADQAPVDVSSVDESSAEAADPSAMPAAFGLFDDDDEDDDEGGSVERASADDDFRISTY